MGLKVHLKAFGAALAECRTRCGMSREDLARKADVPLDLLCAAEQGKPDGLGLSELCRLAAALGIAPCELMKLYESSARDARWW